MKIKSVKIHNFRSIKEESFDLDAFSLLVGENNAGKTNVISALRVFYEEGGTKYNDKKDFPKFDTNDKESWIELTFILSDEENELIKEEYKTADKVLKVRRYFKSDDKELIDSKNSNIFAYEKGELSKNQFYGAKNISSAKLGSAIYIPEMSKTSDTLKLSGPSPLRDITNFVFKKIVSNSPSYSQLNTALEDFNKEFRVESEGNEFSLNSLVQDINEQISHWEIDFGFKINAIKPEDIVKNLLNHYVTDRNLQDSEVDIDNLGQGLQRHIIYTLIRLSSKYVDKKTPKKKDFNPDFTLLLFEEPEAFLHPSQQEYLNLSLKRLSKENQILITTHSTTFVSKNINQLPSIIKVNKNSGRTSVYQIKNEVLEKLWNTNAGMYKYFSDLLVNDSSDSKLIKFIKDKHLGEETPDILKKIDDESFRYSLWLDTERASAFFAKHVLICEGATEKVIFDYLIANSWEELQKKQIYVLDSMGKFNIHRYMNLFSELGINHSVLYDGDGEKIGQEEVNKYINENKNDFTCAIAFFDVDMESFLGYEAPKRKDIKPLTALSKLTNDEIPEEKIQDLKDKITNLLQEKD
ncbi:MAG: AAA family ATPase [Desulforegulaceae bacterium]|nr:AAA family ATPase [Desulforegulaceae bacterium]